MNREYEKDFLKLLESPVLQFEETNMEFCKILLSKLNNKSIILCYDNEVKLKSTMRYLAALDINIENTYYLCDIKKPLSRCNNNIFDEIGKACRSGKLVVSLISFHGLWWNRRLPRKLDYYLNYKKYNYLKEMVSHFVFFNPIYFRTRGQEIYEFAVINREKIIELFSLLADEASKEILFEILRVAITNGVYSLPQGTQETKYWECYKHIEDENWVNCGSATGDTILKYLVSGYKYDNIYAFEGNGQIFGELTEVIGQLPEYLREKIVLANQYIGIDGNGDNFNSLFKGKKVTLINMDIEGAEMPVLRGGSELIRKQRPVLAICAYHKASDLLDIPNYINSICTDYLFFLRKYIGYEPGALNEYVYYCVPKERALFFD